MYPRDVLRIANSSRSSESITSTFIVGDCRRGTDQAADAAAAANAVKRRRMRLMANSNL
jgi:hypothetical protein